MTYSITNPFSGLLPISNIDSGIVTAGGSTVPTPPLYPGMIVTAQDPVLGAGEFILLTGVASNFVGAVCRYNAPGFAAALVTGAAGQTGAYSVGVSMAANTSASTWSWYQIEGLAVIKKTAVQFVPNVPVFMSATAGRIKAINSAGTQLDGAQSANSATVTSTTSTVTVAINRPAVTSATP